MNQNKENLLIRYKCHLGIGGIYVDIDRFRSIKGVTIVSNAELIDLVQQENEEVEIKNAEIFEVKPLIGLQTDKNRKSYPILVLYKEEEEVHSEILWVIVNEKLSKLDLFYILQDHYIPTGAKIWNIENLGGFLQ